MIVVADSGSTKADWIFADKEGNHELVSTRGVNPFLHTPEQITQMISSDLIAKRENVKAVYFYGAGCSDEKRCRFMSEGLTRVYPNAIICVEHDLLAAARATCGKEAGISCILGTGSNSCLYNGEEITDNITSLGYLVGDEGSGSHIGKALLQAYFYREMPETLHHAFQSEFAPDKSHVLDRIYGPDPNVYLASLSLFVTNHIEDPFIRNLCAQCFGIFLDRHVSKYSGCKELPIHFVGSIAHYYEELLVQVLREKGFRPGKFLRKPIRELVTYHLLHNLNK